MTSSEGPLFSLASGPPTLNPPLRVPIGVTAANKQSPLLMHVEYRISFPDHDWVVADQHKLIPLVYARIRIMPDGLGNKEAVSYSGSIYIAIRSGKHSSSTALSHGLDFERLLHLRVRRQA